MSTEYLFPDYFPFHREDLFQFFQKNNFSILSSFTYFKAILKKLVDIFNLKCLYTPGLGRYTLISNIFDRNLDILKNIISSED